MEGILLPDVGELSSHNVPAVVLAYRDDVGDEVVSEAGDDAPVGAVLDVVDLYLCDH